MILLALALGVCVWLLYRWQGTDFDWEAFRRSFRNLHWGWVWAGVGLTYASYYGRVIRWAVLLRSLKPHPSHWNLFVATAIGFTAVVIFGRPGEFVRPYLIARKEGVSISSQMAAWVIERIYDLLLILLLSGFALWRSGDIAQQLGPALRTILDLGGKAILVGAIACLGILVAIHLYSDAVRRRLTEAVGFLGKDHHARAASLIDSFVAGVESTKGGRAVAQLVIFTFVEWVVIALVYYSIFQAQPATSHLSFVDCLVFLGFVALGSIVQLPGIGGGVQVVAVLVLTELFRVPLEPATGLALLIWIVTFVVIMPAGLALALLEGLSLSGIRRIGKEAAI